MEKINGVSEFIFANRIHSGYKRWLKTVDAEHFFSEGLDKAKKREDLDIKFLGDKLMPLTDDQLHHLKQNYPYVSEIVDIVLDAHKENAEVSK